MTEPIVQLKTYRLLGADGTFYQSTERGQLGGNSQDKIYGKLTCKAAINAIPNGYEKVRVFFADEAAAIAAGYRPCGSCMRERFKQWKKGPQEGEDYPWHILP